MWIDTHCHLDPSGFRSPEGADERPAVLRRAREAGVREMVVIGSGFGWEEINTAVTLCSEHTGLHASIAVHPHHASVLLGKGTVRTEFSGEALWQRIETLVHTDPRVVAVGETGLDFHYDQTGHDTQEAVFERFLRLAKDARKPLSLHVRDAHDRALEMVRRVGGVTGVVHCFTGTPDEVSQWLNAGFYISFSGIVTFPSAGNVQAACKRVPLDRMVLETDCPYLAPVPMRGKRNEPAFLTYTGHYVADLLQLPWDIVATQTTKNARNIFQLPSQLQS